LIRDKLSAKQPEAYEWFWSKQVPIVVTSFLNYLEEDPRFTAATAVYVIISLLLHVEVSSNDYSIDIHVIIRLF
jgi:hypothetical protein